jgi:Lon-like protease
VKFDLERIGGPSAGLMFALAIIDKVEPQDLTGGIRIAGTGTIDDEGNVGAIGGIPQKLRGAKRDGATVFLTPAANCAEAVANVVPGVPMVKVTTVDDALNALDALRNGRTPIMC